VPQVFLHGGPGTGGAPTRYQPRLLGLANVAFVDTRKGLEAHEKLALLAAIGDDPVALEWDDAAPAELADDEPAGDDWRAAGNDASAAGAAFAPLPGPATDAKRYARWSKAFADWIYRRRRYELFKSPSLGEISRPGESERDFRIRLTDRAREERDAQLDALRNKYASKFRTLRDRIERAELAVQREKHQAGDAKVQAAISFGSTLLSAVLGRSPLTSGTLGKATTTARGASRASRQADDVRRARAQLEGYREQLEALETEFHQAADEVRVRLDPTMEQFETVTLKPRKSDIDVRLVALAWVPEERLTQA
jgi:hypothetical protein